MPGLKKGFHAAKDEVWKQLAKDLEGEYVKGGSQRDRPKLVAKADDWTVVIDIIDRSNVSPKGVVTQTYTRIRAPYINKDGFRFKIFRKATFDLGTTLGLQDLQVGYPDFDAAFVIKSNNPAKVRQLFGNAKIRQMLMKQPDILFEVKAEDESWFGKAVPDPVDELSFLAFGVINDGARLRSLYDLFAETLNYLCHLGSAYEDDPNIPL